VDAFFLGVTQTFVKVYVLLESLGSRRRLQVDDQELEACGSSTAIGREARI
jgi:hypothetical protein